jgi:hypothetical protein
MHFRSLKAVKIRFLKKFVHNVSTSWTNTKQCKRLRLPADFLPKAPSALLSAKNPGYRAAHVLQFFNL